MRSLRRGATTGVMIGIVTGVSCLAIAGQRDDKIPKDQERPKLTLKAQPMMAIAPARVVFSAELSGGANDFADYYCPTVEWEWGDETRSESTTDCEPYEPGKSEIKRRFTTDHVFRHGGYFRVAFRLKRQNKTLASVTTNVQVRPGVRDR